MSEKSLLLSALSDDARRSLLTQARRVHYPRGAVIFSRADRGETLLVIESGRVEISLTSRAGRKSVLNHMGPGEVLGEVAMLDRGYRSADATAATEVTGKLLDRSSVMGFLGAHPEATFALIGELCAKVRNASEMFATQAQSEAASRLARALLRLGETWGVALPDGCQRIDPRFSQGDLGELSGITRENVNRRLRLWDAEAIIALTPEGIVLKDREALRVIADT